MGIVVSVLLSNSDDFVYYIVTPLYREWWVNKGISEMYRGTRVYNDERQTYYESQNKPYGK